MSTSHSAFPLNTTSVGIPNEDIIHSITARLTGTWLLTSVVVYLSIVSNYNYYQRYGYSNVITD